MPLIYLSSAWIAGILLGSRVNLPWPLFFIFPAPLLLLIRFRERRRLIVLACLCLAALLGGMLRFPLSPPVVDGTSSPFLPGGILWVRDRMSLILASVLPEPQASLAQGMVLGIRSNIPASLNTELSRTGTAHILAISGLNISIVAGILLSLGTWLFGRQRGIYVWLALAAIWWYALLTGMSPPVVRSTIMASLFLIAAILGRQRSAANALALAAAVMVGLSPRLLWNASFQMSFMSMAGLILIAPVFTERGRRLVDRIGEAPVLKPLALMIADSLAVSLGAVIAVWPIIAYYFGVVALVSPVTTLLILPVLPAIIVTGFVSGGLGLFSLPLAQAAGWLAWLFLSYMLLVVGAFAGLPGAINVSPGNASIVWGYYLGLSLVVVIFIKRHKLKDLMAGLSVRTRPGRERIAGILYRIPKKFVLTSLMVIASLVWVGAATMPDANLHVSFLDVGEGDAILIQTPSQQNILVDGGPSPQALENALGKKLPFWSRSFDLVVLTHPHEDHMNGLIDVLNRYRVQQVLYSAEDYATPVYLQWRRELEGLPHTMASAGQQIDLGRGAMLRVLSPPLTPFAGTDSDIDNNSIVLRLSLGQVSFLLTGDISKDAERELIASRASLKSTVLKVAHHGSGTSTSPEFLAAVRPQVAVISVGAGNQFGHPKPEIITRLDQWVGEKNVYRTDLNGTIELMTDGESLWLN